MRYTCVMGLDYKYQRGKMSVIQTESFLTVIVFNEAIILTLPHLVLGWFPCAQVTSHLKCIRLVYVRSSLPCVNIGVRIELTLM